MFRNVVGSIQVIKENVEIKITPCALFSHVTSTLISEKFII